MLHFINTHPISPYSSLFTVAFWPCLAVLNGGLHLSGTLFSLVNLPTVNCRLESDDPPSSVSSEGP